jgi:nicotinamide-nucleotide amidase|uniref:CinA-like protein n=1 Tax=Desulfobacca acetoxidans TaxID=60893 RepID=A0A7V6DPM9_9BACT
MPSSGEPPFPCPPPTVMRMLGEIILTGNELITGRVADVNACYAGRRLHESGLAVQCITVLGDGAPLFGEVLHRALSRSRFVIITGGLGPTDDDMTVAQAAEVLHLKLVQDEAMLARMRRRCEERGLPWLPHYGKMALIPAGATILDTGRSACGFSLKYQDVWLFFLPGVPHEMRHLLEAAVLPVLTAMAGHTGYLEQRSLRLFGKMELEVQQAVHRLQKDAEGLDIGFYPNFPEIHLSLTARGPEKAKLTEKLDRFVAALSREVGDVLLSMDGAPLEEVVGRLLRQQGRTLAVAESCSGGLICHRLTNVSGSSEYFQGGAVTYSNQAKMDLLRVPGGTLEKQGAVSSDTAAAMARGVRKLFHADFGLAVTGIAGPTGGTPAKPVGLVFMGLADEHAVETRQHHFPGDRDMVKTLTAEHALDWLRRRLLAQEAG